MLAKLFNNISLQSLVRALGFSLLVIVLVIFFGPRIQANFHFGASVYPVATNWYRFIFGAVAFICAWLLNSAINRFGFLKNDYQFIPVFTLSLLPLYFFVSSLEYILVVPLGILLLLRLLSIAQKSPETYALFDAGTIAGIMVLLVPESILFVVLACVSVLVFGRIYIRAFFMPLIGLSAIWFVAFTVLYWLTDSEAAAVIEGTMQRVEIGLHLDFFSQGWWRFLPLLLVLLFSLLEIFQVYGKASNFKRQSFTFLLMMFVLFLTTGALLQDQSRLWMWLPIPLAVFMVNLIHYIRKKWMKDLVYLGLLLSLALLLFA